MNKSTLKDRKDCRKEIIIKDILYITSDHIYTYIHTRNEDCANSIRKPMKRVIHDGQHKTEDGYYYHYHPARYAIGDRHLAFHAWYYTW